MASGVLVLGEATDDGKLNPVVSELIGAGTRLGGPVTWALLGARGAGAEGRGRAEAAGGPPRLRRQPPPPLSDQAPPADPPPARQGEGATAARRLPPGRDRQAT